MSGPGGTWRSSRCRRPVRKESNRIFGAIAPGASLADLIASDASRGTPNVYDQKKGIDRRCHADYVAEWIDEPVQGGSTAAAHVTRPARPDYPLRVLPHLAFLRFADRLCADRFGG